MLQKNKYNNNDFEPKTIYCCRVYAGARVWRPFYIWRALELSCGSVALNQNNMRIVGVLPEAHYKNR